MTNPVVAVLRRELVSYFVTPVAYVFIAIFLLLASLLTFHMGNFFDRGQADLYAFFQWHPWLYLFLVSAIAMRLWSEERKTGTLEILMTLPITAGQAVVGKFLAAWIFTGIALSLTFPLWITVAYLGDPDHGVIIGSYIGSFLMAGGYLAIGSCVSALTRNQVIAFVVSVSVCFLFTVSGLPIVLNFFSAWTPQALLDAIASFSFLTHFNDLSRGVIDLRDLVFFGSLIVGALLLNTVIIDAKRGS